MRQTALLAGDPNGVASPSVKLPQPPARSKAVRRRVASRFHHVPPSRRNPGSVESAAGELVINAALHALPAGR
jgi:hypothetical protein